MSILFYDHLINLDHIRLYLEKLDLPEEKRSQFKTMIDDILHAGLMEYILQKLHPHHHHTFLTQLERAPYDPELLTYLKQNADTNIESALEKEGQRLIRLILKDLKADNEAESNPIRLK